MWAPAPKLWIPSDEARVSRQEVAHTRPSVFISDQACTLVMRKRGKGRVVCDMEESPLHEQRVIY